MEMFEERLTGRTVFTGRVFTVEVDKVLCPDGTVADREVVRHGGGVGILAVDESDRVVMVRQYRYAQGRVFLEIPAGKLEKGEDPAACAERELSEETGMRCKSCVPLGRIVPTGAYDTETIWLYLAEGLSGGEPHPDEGEFLSCEKIPFARLEEMVASGALTDAKTIAALYYLRLLRRKQNGKEGSNH